MNPTFPPSDDATLGLLLRLIGRASDSMGRALEAREGMTPEASPEAAEARDERPAGDTTGDNDVESATVDFFARLEEAARSEASQAAAPAPRSRPAGTSSLRPGRDWPEAASQPALTPSPRAPSPVVWRRAVLFPADEAPEEYREAVRWLEAEIARLAQEGEGPAAREPRERPAVAAGHEPEPREEIRDLARGLPKPVRLLLGEIAEHYCDRGYRVFRIQRQAEATDWHVKLLRKELGFTLRNCIRELRLAKILPLLRDTPLGVQQLAGQTGFGSKRSVRALFNSLCAFSPSEARTYLRRVRREQRPRCDELLSWRFWVRHHRGELGVDDLRAALAYLEDRFDTP